jgi:hypothetical protein
MANNINYNYNTTNTENVPKAHCEGDNQVQVFYTYCLYESEERKNLKIGNIIKSSLKIYQPKKKQGAKCSLQFL